MSYSTQFYGAFRISPDLTPGQIAEINEFSETRHDRPNKNFVENSLNRQGEVVDLEGCEHPVWCRWRVFLPGEDWQGLHFENDGQVLTWNRYEKFRDYVPWLRFLVKRFFDPWGVDLFGEVEWEGEDEDDRGKIVVGPRNEVKVYRGIVKVEYEEI